MGTQLPPSQKGGGTPPQFSAHVYCGQTAAWMKMPLCTQVGLGPDNIVLDGDEDPFQKGGRAPSPSFDPCLLWPNGWIDEDATWYGSRHRPRPHCVRRTEVPTKGAQQPPPSFRPMSIVAMAAHLSLVQMVTQKLFHYHNILTSMHVNTIYRFHV